MVLGELVLDLVHLFYRGCIGSIAIQERKIIETK